jgi:uncharacterized protein (TIRG00374 family)
VQVLLSLGLIVLVVILLLPQLSGEEQSLHTLRGLSIPLAVTAVALEAASLVSYSVMTALVFGAHIPFLTLVRIDLTITGLSHAVPAGGPTAAVLRMRLLQRAGLPGSSAVAGATVQATAANIVLGCVFLIGVALLLAEGSDATSYFAAAGAVIGVALVTIAAGLLLVHRGPATASWVSGRLGRLPGIPRRNPDRLIRALSVRLADMVRHPSRTGRVLGCSALNWLLDASVLWVMLAATGHHLAVGPLLAVYGLGNILAILPLTPGGLGIVEGVMIPALIGFDVPSASALVGVLGWRLWQFWLPIPVAGVCYLSLRIEDVVRKRRGGGMRTDGARTSRSRN